MKETKQTNEGQLDFIKISQLIGQIDGKKHLLLDSDHELSQISLDLTTALYRLAKSQELVYNLNGKEEVTYQKQSLKRLMTEGFETEQVWQQIQRRNKPFLEYAEPLVSNLLDDDISSERSQSDEENLGSELSNSEDLSDEDINEEQDELASDEENEGYDEFEISRSDEGGMEDEDSGNEGSLTLDEEIEGGYQGFGSQDKENDEEEEEEEEEEKDFEETEVDDEFFSLNKMHKVVEDAERDELASPEQESDEEESEIDFDQNIEDDDDDFKADQATFADFFKSVKKGKGNKQPRSSKKVDESDDEMDGAPRQLFADDDEGSEDEDVEKPSKFEKRQEKMSKIIDELEEENVGAKPWTMMGEATAKNRPLDSLLEEDLEFDNASKPVPVVTVEVTQSLEQLIQQRIIEMRFDDVTAPAKDPKRTKFDKDGIELDHEKSKRSLAEVYEDEYRASTIPQASEVELTPRLIKTHEEIEVLFTNLCYKLDALSHSQYTPKMAKLEVKVVHDAPAITIEEAIPVAVSDATRLAPQEIHGHTHKGQAGNLTNKDELSQEERNRLRNRKKRLAKTRSKNKPTTSAATTSIPSTSA